MREPPAAAPPFKNRSTRLTVFGIVSILVGCLCIAVGLLGLSLPFLVQLSGLDAPPLDPRSALGGLVVYTALGTAFIVVGLGSIRGRRWVRPLMIILAWNWLLCGLVGLAFIYILLDSLFVVPSDEPLPAAAAWMFKLLLLGAWAVFGVALPGVFIWVYRDRDLSRTLEARDPTPAWTDRCPLPVLGLSVGLGAGAAVSLPMALRPAVPLFGRILTGWVAALLMLLTAVACGLLARATYRLRTSGWWGASILFTLVGASTLTTFLSTEPDELYRQLGYPEMPMPGSASLGGLLGMGMGAALTLLSLIYMLAIRRYFVGSSQK